MGSGDETICHEDIHNLNGACNGIGQTASADVGHITSLFMSMNLLRSKKEAGKIKCMLLSQLQRWFRFFLATPTLAEPDPFPEGER